MPFIGATSQVIHAKNRQNASFLERGTDGLIPHALAGDATIKSGISAMGSLFLDPAVVLKLVLKSIAKSRVS
jgi:hypothetical protein